MDLIILNRQSNGGRGSLVVKITDSWLAHHEFKPGPAEDIPCRGGETMHVKYVEAQNVLSLVWWRIKSEVPAQVSTSSPGHQYEFVAKSPRIGSKCNVNLSGHVQKYVACELLVRVMVSLKFRHVVRLMHAKSDETQSPRVV
ncbi:hypothetical protein TNCV_4427931 [Trichonephila clavipes]|nr:hypothetical protein TNCV_4427931 [Trichonephila clavipes]